ncbi:MAG TPA: response regulator [Anaerolineales bacterium]|jgi:pilus assembly protein CpaE
MTESSEGQIRVLIVDDIAETRENIRRLLQFETDIDVVGAARSGEEALQIAADIEPDVVLMDINMPDMDGIAVTEALLRDVPYAQVVMLSVQSEADYMRRAMLAGARDFIAKPPSGDELIRTIRLVSERAKEQKAKLAAVPVMQLPGTGPIRGVTGAIEGKLLAVYSAKGGVGCSMLATNIALGLHTDETPTVLVDAHLQFGDVSVSLNMQVKNSLVDLAARADELDRDYVEDVLITHETGLKVLAAPPRPEMADEVQADQLRKVLSFLKRNFAYVVVDTSSTMDDITLAVLDACDVLMTVATPDIPSIKDTRLLFDLLSVLEFPRERIFFVLNKMERKTGITAEAIAENLKRPVEGQIPSDEKLVSASINKGIPLILGDKGKAPARNILELIGTLRQRLVAQPEEEVLEAEAERPRLASR